MDCSICCVTLDTDGDALQRVLQVAQHHPPLFVVLQPPLDQIVGNEFPKEVPFVQHRHLIRLAEVETYLTLPYV